ncbi:hypothetical protein ACIGGF_25255 [Rhodococcus sp. NPDC078407]|uniref:hypothetical protein n=1 Tax=Rhodococcus sp. NPDC078407 TaxID=3364509 RepID=UPI0037C5B71C
MREVSVIENERFAGAIDADLVKAFVVLVRPEADDVGFRFRHVAPAPRNRLRRLANDPQAVSLRSVKAARTIHARHPRFFGSK